MKRADRKSWKSAKHEYVRSRPFVNWINERMEFYTHRFEQPPCGDVLSPQQQVLSEIGWSVTEAGARRLYRYRHNILDGSENGVKGPRMTEWYPRVVVENALWMAGVDFFELYPEFASERDVPLEPAAWCPSCRDHCHPIEGVCPWCEWRISEGHMNRKLAA